MLSDYRLLSAGDDATSCCLRRRRWQWKQEIFSREKAINGSSGAMRLDILGFQTARRWDGGEDTGEAVAEQEESGGFRGERWEWGKREEWEKARRPILAGEGSVPGTDASGCGGRKR